MPERNDKIDDLQAQLNRLVRTQIDFQREVTRIREDLERLRSEQTAASPVVETHSAIDTEPVAESMPAEPPVSKYARPKAEPSQPFVPTFDYRKTKKTDEPREPAKTVSASDLEKFIGENLLSKIGIVILVIGVAIGGKYAIDNGWVSPLMRIIFGYACGLALIGIAVRLKPRYLNFSAVLISGGMAIMYFITYFAYAFYGLITQPAAFVLMVLFTAFTVVAALIYSKQIIAHIGLVGGYATPFLLSTGSANYPFLFTYIAIINLGILAISLSKYWKPVFYTSFFFTWAIFAVWFADRFRAEEHFALALGFATIYFLIFYGSFIAYKLFTDTNLEAENVIVILLNSGLYFVLGCAILTRPDGDTAYLGTFAVINAAIHLGFAFMADGIQKVPSDTVYLCAALVLLFLTIAIPLQFDGNVVTLFWSAEAFALFFIGRKKGIALFEIASYPAAALATLSLVVLWGNSYDLSAHGTVFPTFLNSSFVSGMFYVLAMAGIAVIDRSDKGSPLPESLALVVRYGLRFVAVAALYNVFRMEIDFYFRNKAIEMRPPGGGEYFRVFSDLEYLSAVWQINYTLVFFALLGFIDIKRWRDRFVSFAVIGVIAFAVFIFCTAGLISLGEVYRVYSGDLSIILPLRYISLACLSAAVFVIYRYMHGDKLFSKNLKLKELLFDGFFFTLLWIILSNELVTWMAIFGIKDSFKLGLSILWGIYALVLVVIGISRSKKHLRIGAIGLFAVTLIKLFFYDIAYMDTISKTAVFVLLGVLILVVAFLYNKYASQIFSAKEDEEV